MTKGKTQYRKIINDKFKEVCDILLRDGYAKSVTGLAKLLETTPNVVSDIMNGKRNVTVQMIGVVCQKFNVNASYLFPPFDKNMFYTENLNHLIRLKKLEVEKLKLEISFLQSK